MPRKVAWNCPEDSKRTETHRSGAGHLTQRLECPSSWGFPVVRTWFTPTTKPAIKRGSVCEIITGKVLLNQWCFGGPVGNNKPAAAGFSSLFHLVTHDHQTLAEI